MVVCLCGLFGWSIKRSKLGFTNRAMLAAVLSTRSDSRGGDSFSWWSPNGIVKGIGEVSTQAFRLLNEDIVSGHTRKATHGVVNTANAHSFNIGNIAAGSHNGIIMNHNELNYKYGRKCEVDSMHIFHHLNEGMDLSDLHGYGSIEWVEKGSNRIYLCKLAGGELAIYGLKGRAGIIWASDEDHVEEALKVSKIKANPFKVETGQVYFIENDKLYLDDRKLELASRETTHMPHWSGGYSYNNSGWVSSDYEEMMDSMSSDEEKEFRRLWELSDDTDLAKLAKEVDAEKTLFTKTETPALPANTSSNAPFTDLDGAEEWDRGEGRWVTKLKDGTIVEGMGHEAYKKVHGMNDV